MFIKILASITYLLVIHEFVGNQLPFWLFALIMVAGVSVLSFFLDNFIEGFTKGLHGE